MKIRVTDISDRQRRINERFNLLRLLLNTMFSFSLDSIEHQTRLSDLELTNKQLRGFFQKVAKSSLKAKIQELRQIDSIIDIARYLVGQTEKIRLTGQF